MFIRIHGRSPWDTAALAPVVEGLSKRLRRAREPLILASVGLLYFVGSALEPTRRIKDLLAAGLWQILFAVALAVLIIVVVDDRRLRRRLRAQALRNSQGEAAREVVLER